MKIKFKIKKRARITTPGTHIVYGFKEDEGTVPVTAIFMIESVTDDLVFLQHHDGRVDRYLSVNDRCWSDGRWRYATANEKQRYEDCIKRWP